MTFFCSVFTSNFFPPEAWQLINLLSICCLSAILKSRISPYFESQRIKKEFLSKHHTISQLNQVKTHRYFPRCFGGNQKPGISMTLPGHLEVKSQYLRPAISGPGGDVVAIDWCIIHSCPIWLARPHSAVGNVSGYRCVSDCRSRGREFNPGPVAYFRGDWSWNKFYGHSPPFRWYIQEGLRKYVHQLLVNRLFKPAQEKRVVRWTDRPAMTIAVDLGHKATKQTNKTNLVNLQVPAYQGTQSPPSTAQGGHSGH